MVAEAPLTGGLGRHHTQDTRDYRDSELPNFFLRLALAHRDLDRGDEPIAAPWNIDDEPIALASVTQRAAQCRNMYGKVCRLDKYVGPNETHQFFFRDQLTCSI